ncbi:hypothetical protein FLONG3_2427 [Fusarium longipes]|uniref:Uncharacterized protein n=1 Tax=Fusarium longipes TaxID=694270 RepID=A0A395T4R2_9HYPO|nr:hypothetical protein FLONG3_2427 [Fusarium longipes]
MASHLGSFTPAMDEVKVDQITESSIFNVVAMLPTSLQSVPIRFLRRSISFHTLRPDVAISGSRAKPRPLSETDATAMSRPLAPDMVKHSSRYPEESQDLCPQPMSRVLFSELPEDEPVMRAASGVHWKFARQGTNLVNISVDGGKAAVAEEDVAFERKAFVDGVTYLLKALPQDLDEGELKRIQSALPDSVSRQELCLARPEGQPNRAMVRDSQPRSIIHRGVKMTVVNLIFFLSFLMPYLLLLVRYAARVERKYKISETIIGHGVDLANSIGKQSASLTEAVGQMNDGKVAQALLEVFVWTVDGVTQGISDGLGEGLSIVGSKPKS